MRNSKSGWLLSVAMLAVLLSLSVTGCEQHKEHGGKEHAGAPTP